MNTIAVPSRPVLRYHGGKWRLAPWIISHFPKHRVYVEPYGGGGSVLIRKPRSYAEIYNDIYPEVVTLFRVLRDPSSAAELIRRVALTPFAREEFEEARFAATLDDIETARRLVVRSFMGFGSAGVLGDTTGFRAASNRSGTTPAHDWANLPDAYGVLAARLQGVVIEQRDATTVMRRHDCIDALHYVDPPYMAETRSGSKSGEGRWHGYRHELTTEDHASLLDTLKGLKGMVVVSGYPAPLYDAALADWRRVERRALADGAQQRTEVLWINPAAKAALEHGPLFAVDGGA
jgi:DNA adenine methylase